MSIWKQFISTLTVFTLVFGVAVTVIFRRPGEGLQPREVKLVLEGVVLSVFAGMNVLYVLLWKKNAAEDYFEARGEAMPPQAEPKYREDQNRQDECACGYDLQANPAEWVQPDPNIASRCPNCGREIAE